MKTLNEKHDEQSGVGPLGEYYCGITVPVPGAPIVR
jgi:hypothetical protein